MSPVDTKLKARIETLDAKLSRRAIERTTLHALAGRYNDLVQDLNRVRAGFKPSHQIRSLAGRRKEIDAELQAIEATSKEAP